MNDLKRQWRMNDLKRQWNDTRRVPNGFTLASASPIECLIGWDEQLHRCLRAVSRFEAFALQSSKKVVSKRWRQSDQRNVFQLSLLSEDENEVFMDMCFDLIRYAQYEKDESEAFRKLQLRWQEWYNLFSFNRTGLLSEEEQRGLIGELLFLREQLVESDRPLDETVENWRGPFGEPQDFLYEDGWHEIKTVMDRAKSIKISSIEQLSRTDAGELVVYRLLESSSDGAFTLNSIVKEIMELVWDEPYARIWFQGRLFAAGYIERKEYDRKRYKLIELLKFDVDENFPRLRRDRLPAAILEAKYSLDLDQLIARVDRTEARADGR